MCDNSKCVGSLSDKLNAYIDTLPERERKFILSIILSLMDPMERMNWVDANKLLSFREAEILRNLENIKAEP
jgi:hypothetical protein